ncbi:hypothetical protein [Streptomyces cinnamoneus]|uniref:hypothetical protein n=1 Tax=Streptomyces cinnamoneus TaxID=53446 RepID=UPI000C081B9E|nr:hypothetical protein [Streptomyces cinnamoneus]PPT12251.1 hypothetical protein CYQ11_04475 [Streptomyces cinnamoneus]
MGRRGLPRPLTDSTQLPHSRDLAHAVADNARDMFHPLIIIARGMRALAASARRSWERMPKDRRGPTVLLVVSCLVIVALIPYGPTLATVSLVIAGVWAGRERGGRPARAGHVVERIDGDEQGARLQGLYEALVPYFSAPQDPRPLYGHGGSWRHAFEDHEFDDLGQLTGLRLRYPGYFTDGEAESRARIEQLLHLKAGRGREYRFDWDEATNHLTLTALPELSTGIWAQPFVTAPGETVLGFTDATAVQRTLPVLDGDVPRDAPPVVWRTGQRSTEPHLLVLGRPAAGTTTLLRSLTLQALLHGDVVVVDGGSTGEFACLVGREGVLTVESSFSGALATLEWACHETERRLMTANYARRQGRPAPDDIRRPLWIVVDRPAALSHLAAGQGRPDPQELLQVPLRHGRMANVTVVVGEQLDSAGLLAPHLPGQTEARVVLGAVSPEQVAAVLGAPPCTTPTDRVPPGRGYARLGAGPVLRLQVPATPDPHDEATSEAQRRAVLRLLPDWAGAAPAPAWPATRGEGDGPIPFQPTE